MTSPERLVVRVTRSRERDVAEWVPASQAGPSASSDAAGQSQSSSGDAASSAPRIFVIVASLAVITGTVLLLRGTRPELSKPLVPTVADLAAVHSGVSADGVDVRRVTRLRVGDVVETDTDGRARLRLDDGTALVIDRKTKLKLSATGIELLEGRVFVLGAAGARTELALGGATAVVSGANAGVQRTRDSAKVYAATAEITVRGASGEQTARAGETASVEGTAVKVAPERAFDDWTGGMAAPWGAKGPPRRAVGELWGRPEGSAPGEPGSPLAIRSHDVRATVHGEIAETKVATTYFNAGSGGVSGDFRMALPSGAIVSRFAVSDNSAAPREGKIGVAARERNASRSGGALLEWAGEGWLRGFVPSIASGATVTVTVEYIEWLAPTPRSGKTLVVQYRYPMASDATPPLVGEFSAIVDASPAEPSSMAAGFGARATGHAVELRRPDFRPTADLVVDVEIPAFKSPARAYVAPPLPGEDAATLVVRTEAPAATGADSKKEGVTLALVLDTSGSIEPALLDAERALVDAVLGGLGAQDRAIVLAADQTARAVGPATIGPVDDARRKAVKEALSTLSPGGASDLGRALEAGADALPADAPAGLVVYVGDGRATLGDSGVERILARLARRPGGAPRLGAVAVGPLANRFALAGIVRGSGPLLEIADSTDAATVAVTLVSEALRPTIAGVSVAFGPEVEQVYPRSARAIAAGDTIVAVGKLRAGPPRELTVRWRGPDGVREEKRAISIERTASGDDVRRRWAAARVEEIVLSGKGREAAADVAYRAGLVTPYTALITGSPPYVPSPLSARILDLSASTDGPFGALFATARGTPGTLADVPREVEAEEVDSEDQFKSSIAAAAARVIYEAGPAVRACRDSRAALRPELAGELAVTLEIDGDGRADGVKVRGTTPTDDDPALDRCVAVVLSGLSYPASGLTVKIKVTHTIDLPPPKATLRGRKCSATSTLPLPLRRGVWRERLDRGVPWTVYLEAKSSCELPTWTDRRTLLELVLETNEDGLWRVDVARNLDRAGDLDAATLLRREAVRRARTPEELSAIKVALVGDERYPLGTFKKKYKAATDDPGRLGVVRRFLAVAPHDARLKRRLLALLEAMGKKDELVDEIRRVRIDPFTDAGLLADAASTFKRLGDEDEARRTFGELTERAPHDPWARAFLGDRLRNEGWFDDATAAYAVLEELIPDEPSAIVRLASAHAGAGRLDVATRMLARVAQTGGRAGDGQLGEMAGRLSLVLLAEARRGADVSQEDEGRLIRASLEIPRPAQATLLVLRAPAGAIPIEVKLVRGPKDAREERSPEVAAPGMGLYALRLDPEETSGVVLKLKRREELAPAPPTKVRVDAIVPDGAGKAPRLVSTDVELPIDGKPVELQWAAGAWGR